MNLASRVIAGALAGALLVLLFHPLSSPLLLHGFLGVGPSNTLTESSLVSTNLRTLKAPSNRREAALYFQINSRRVLQGVSFTPSEAMSLAQQAARFGEEDRDNAFWRQLEAIFFWRAGDRAASLAAWDAASNALRWDDGQTARLLQLQFELDTEARRELAWHPAAIKSDRLPFASALILRFGRDLMRQPETSLADRFNTFENGMLMLDGARSVEVGVLAVDLMQASSVFRGQREAVSFAQRLRQRQAFVDQLRSAGNLTEASVVDSGFRNADSWLNLVASKDNLQRQEERTVAAVLASILPGIGLHLALLGVLVALVAMMVERVPAVRKVLGLPGATILGVVAGVAVFNATGLFFPAIWTTLSLGFFVFQRPHVRTMSPDSLKREHRLTLIPISLACAAFYVAFISGLTEPFRVFASQFGVPQEYQAGSSLLLGLSLLMLSVAVFTAPVWGLLEKQDSVKLLSLSLRQTGVVLLCVGVGVTVALTPVCVAVDRQVREPLAKALLNEPNLFLSE